MQVWANTDSNDHLFHAFTGKAGADLRAMCNGRIRPAERHRRGDCGLLTADSTRALPFTTHLCERCTAKVDAPTKSAPVEVTTGGAPLYKRAGLRHAAVGRGRRVHYSRGNDDSLCGRGISAYLSIEQAAARFDRGDELCTRCVMAAEELAYAKSLAAASPTTRAAAELAEIVADTDEANRRFRNAMDSITRTNNTSSLSELARWTSSLWPHVDQTGAPQEFHLLMTRAAGTTHLATLAEIARRAGHLWDHPEDAAEEPQAPAPSEKRVVCGDGRERVVIGTVDRPGEPARVVVEGGAEWLADECRPVRSTPAGSAPGDAAHPDTLAALAILDGTPLATITDEHDFTGSDDYDETAHGALVEPRGYGRVAVYWLVGGLYVTPDEREPHRAELRTLAGKFRAAGWEIEPSSVRSVFAWRPSAAA